MQSTQVQKNWMALTGGFLCFFLVIHLLGNLQLLLPPEQARHSFNWYSKFLSGNLFIKLIELVLLASILGHIGYSIVLTYRSSKSNGARYQFDKRRSASTWNSRNMGLLGFIILLFLIIHLKDFWYKYKFLSLPLDKDGQVDLYTVVIETYRQWWYVLIYLIGMAALGFHLLHGFFSAARTLGLYNPKYVKACQVTGWIYTVCITGGFMIIPLYIHFTNR